MSRRPKPRIQIIRETIMILAILFVAGMFVTMTLFNHYTAEDPGAEPALRIQLWCEGYAEGMTLIITRTGHAPPYQNQHARIMEECKQGEIYLVPYVIQPGTSPSLGQDDLWSDRIQESIDQPSSIPICPAMLRQSGACD